MSHFPIQALVVEWDRPTEGKRKKISTLHYLKVQFGYQEDLLAHHMAYAGINVSKSSL